MIVSLMLAACSKSNIVVPLNFTYTRMTPTVTANGKRFYLVHGSLSGDRSDWVNEHYLPLTNAIRGMGYEVITFDRVPFTRQFLADSGLQYRQEFLNQFLIIMGKVEAAHGLKQNYIGGASMGGIHASMLVADMPGKFEAYFTLHPVVIMSALTELNGLTSVYFNPQNEVPVLETMKSYIAYSDNDTRVGSQNTIDLINMMNNPDLTTIMYPGIGHSATPQMMTDCAAWIATL